jgi:hypothetical protein
LNKPDFYHASDYAGLRFKDGEFYYGYEHAICKECGETNGPGTEYCANHEDADRDWCFVAKFDGKEIVIPFSKLGASDMFNVVECLAVGMGWLLAKYKLTLKT